MKRKLTKKSKKGKKLKKSKKLKKGLQEGDSIKIIKKYPTQKCATPGCRNNAVGSGDLCKRCGGSPVIKENLLAAHEIPDGVLALTKYDPKTHPMAFIDYSRSGMSDVEIAAKFEVSVSTLRGWSEKFLEFNQAYEIGQALHEAWYLQQGKENLTNRGFNTQLFKFLTGNKLGYSDKIESKSLNVTAGVLLVPKPSSTVEEWEKEYGADSIVDAEVVENDES